MYAYYRYSISWYQTTLGKNGHIYKCSIYIRDEIILVLCVQEQIKKMCLIKPI